MITAPWTPEQVDALNRYQQAGRFHPFTCPEGHGSLTATADGWVCSLGIDRCDYTQNWAHEFILGRS
jgi:hypothetical protein